MPHNLEGVGTLTLLDPAERVKRFGIECTGPAGDGITFSAGDWKPGGEYIQKLTVRNVTTTVKKFKYKLPETRYFSLAYPEVITLSPGMYTEIDVVFRPVTDDPYDDVIVFRMQEGEKSGAFQVPVVALIPKLLVSTPTGIDMGFCPTHQLTQKTFQMENYGEIEAPFRWEVPYPFELSPAEGVIPVGQVQDITISINPKAASVFVSKCTCFVGENVHAIIPDPVLITDLSAIGKYTYVVLSDHTVEFGEVLTGTPHEMKSKEVVLRNQGVVPAIFKCTRHDNDRDEVFHIFPREGVVPTQGELTVTVSYSALAAGMFSLDEYTFETPGGCKATLTVSGQSMPTKVDLYRDLVGGATACSASPIDSINFRDTEVGVQETRTIFLKNHSSVPTNFSVVGDPMGLFTIEPNSGVIPALLEKHFKITFLPTKPINYYRRFFVLIGDALPLLMDVMGTGFIRAKGEIKEQRPAPLRHAHIQAYRNRCTAGIGHMGPDEMDEMVKNEGLSDLFAKVGTVGSKPVSVAMLKNPLTRTGEASRIEVAPAHEFFINDDEVHCRGVTLSTTYVDFGYCPYSTTSPAQVVSLTNHTASKVAIMWFPPKIRSDVGQGEPVFRIEPNEAEIVPGKSLKFKVYFNPLQSNRNFLSDVEVYCFFKNQRTFRLVNDATLTPPWCLSLRTTGHTFPSGQLLAKVSFNSGGIRGGKLAFPTCVLGDSVFQTVKLRNSSNLPSLFKIELGFDNNTGELDGVEESEFSVKPQTGEIGADDFALICIRYSPKSTKKVLQLLRCLVNGSPGGQLLLEGTGTVPQISCPDFDVGENSSGAVVKIGSILPKKPYLGKSFSLIPTCIGLSSSRNFIIKNISRVPVRFYCTLPLAVNGIIDVSPANGLLRGNASASISISFAPQSQKKVETKMQILMFPIGGKPEPVIDGRQPGAVAKVEPIQNFKVNLVAQGTVGAIVFNPSDVCTDVQLVNTTESRHIILENVCDSVLSFELYYKTAFTPETGSTSSKQVIFPLQSVQTSAASKDGSLDGHQSIYCEKPTGLLPARSRNSILFTFQPNRAGLFNFTIYCRLRSVDSRGKPTSISNEESTLLHVSKMKLEKMLENNEEIDLESTVSDKDVDGLPLTMTISGRASFPTMKVEDIRSEQDNLVSDINQLWKQFSIAAINHEMNKPLTDEEVSFNTISSPDLSALKRYPFKFVPNVIGSPKQTYFLEIKNCGFLTTSFKLTLPNEKELDLENWCDEEEMTEERLRHVSILEEIGCFEISPREGVLQPGESRVMTISYDHNSLKYGGHHVLPVHLKLSQGKQFWIDFTGTTLADLGDAPRLPPSRNGEVVEAPQNINLFVFTGADNVFTLGSIPLGIKNFELPLQRMEIVNPSGYNITYDFEMKAIHKLSSDNFNEEIFKIISPHGIVHARSSAYVEWVFNPLEAKMYEVELNVRYQVDPSSQQPQMAIAPASMSRSLSSSQSRAHSRKNSNKHATTSSMNIKYLSVILKGRGYDPRLEKPLADDALHIGSSPPSKRLVQVETLASLSQDLINFGIIPKCFNTSRIVVLRNHSSHDLEFVVDDTCSHLSDMGEGILTVFPRTGVMPPNGFVSLEVTILANFPALVILDRLKVVVQTVVKQVAKRAGGSRHDKLKSRIMSRGKTGASIHTEIVTSPTFSRSQYIDNVTFNDGSRTAKYPTRSMNGGSTTGGGNRVGSAGSQNFEQSFFSHSQPGSPTAATEGFNHTMSTAGSGLMPSGSGISVGTSVNGGGIVHGPPEVHLLRLTGEVYSPEVINKVFDIGPQKNVLDNFVAPVRPIFISPRPDQMPDKNSPPTSTAVAAIPNNSSNKQIKTVPITQREFEIRDVVGEIIGNVFRDVLNSQETSEQLLTSAMAVSRGLELPPAINGENEAPLIPVGGPVYGVYFEEVVPRLQTAFTFIQELHKLKVPYHAEDNSSISDDKKKKTGIAHSDFIVNKSDLRLTLVQSFGFSRKGELFKEIEAAMELTRNDFVAVRDFVPALSDRVVKKLELGCLNLQKSREKKSKIKRQQSMIMKQKQDKGGSPRGARPSLIESTPLSPLKENPVQVKQKTVSTDINNLQDEMELADEAKKRELLAVTNIQKFARRQSSIQIVQKKKDKINDLRTKEVMVQDEFVGIVADVLRNTMSNLMQEALHDEFQLDAEPMKFMMKVD